MSPELLLYSKKVDSVREVLKNCGFEELQFFWYSDGFYNSGWNNMSVATEKPDSEEAFTMWQFGFKSHNNIHKRLHLEALVPYTENYLRFELRYYPEIKLHDREGYMGPVAHFTVSDILEQDLTNLQNHIDFLINLI